MSTTPATNMSSSGNVSSSSSHCCTCTQSKTLILCFDGTLNRYNKSISNIARFVSLLEKNDPSRQMVYYQAGAGTSIGPAYLGRAVQYIEEIWDSAFASSLDQHVCSHLSISAYEILTLYFFITGDGRVQVPPEQLERRRSYLYDFDNLCCPSES